MENSKRKISYSVIRYSPDKLKGEIINVGLLLHDHLGKKVKIFMLDEKSTKMRAIMSNDIEVNIYKTYKDILELYLKKSKEDISGVVGNMYIASYYEDDFMDKIYKYYENKELKLSMPSMAYTKNEDKLFETILKRYVGEGNVDVEHTATLTAKKYMRQIFSKNENLNKRIKTDAIIKPIEELEDLEIKIDFSFKNGVWNYMQTIPKITSLNKNSEWFSKIQLILESNIADKSKIHLIYKKSDFIQDKATYNLIQYLKSKYCTLEIHDIDKKSDVYNLCSYIEAEAQILENVG